ncbi:MAG: hypothetical protein F4X39_05400, partial [Acidobacteriia bacterium]|nr:hypothetical protein [Terriglobia bacterium]
MADFEKQHSPDHSGNNNGVNRRHFVHTAGAASAAAILPKAKGAPLVRTAKAAGMQVNYGFIGPGSRGFRLLKRHLQHIEIGNCVGICDIYQPNLQ